MEISATLSLRVLRTVGLLVAAVLPFSVIPVASGAPTAPSVTAVGSGPCSKAEAIAAVKRLGLSDVSATYPVHKVLCGAFTGAGSQTMVASISGPDNVGMIYWAIFRWSGIDWRLLMKQRQAAVLTAAESDIRETVSIYREGDPRCCPSGGTKARLWDWNGVRFTAGSWKQVPPATPAPPVGGAATNGFFKTPSSNILCSYANSTGAASVGCVVKSGLKPPPPRRGPECSPGLVVGLGATGRVHTEGSECPGEDAPETPYVGADVARVLGYGKTWSGGGIHCTSAVTGLTCRNRRGHGFFLSRDKWRAF